MSLLTKLIPLYALILLGFIAGRFLGVAKGSVAALLIYIIAPVVVFNGVITTKIDFAMLFLPALFFLIASVLCLASYFLSSLILKTSERNILAFTAGAGNTGYFGLPMVMVLLGAAQFGIAVLLTLGIIVYENTLGFFITAKGQHSGRVAVMKLLCLPVIYAFFLGLIFNVYHIPIGMTVAGSINNFMGAYVVLGMMLIGLGLSGVTRVSLDYVFTAWALVTKFVVWPLLMGIFIFIDWQFLQLYNPVIYKIAALMSVVPLAGNTVVFATQLNTHPEKAAVTVLASSLFALFFIPVFVSIVFPIIDRLAH